MALRVLGQQPLYDLFRLEDFEDERERDSRIFHVGLNCVASLAVAGCAFKATRTYGAYSVYISCSAAFAITCNLMDRVAPIEADSAFDEETVDRLARIVWVSQFILGSVFLGSSLAGLLNGGQWILAGIKNKEALAICRGIEFLLWETGFVAPAAALLLRASLPFEDRHLGLLKQMEEAAPGHLILENLIEHARAFSPWLFFQKLSFVTAAEFLGSIANESSFLWSFAHFLACFYAQHQLFQTLNDLFRSGTNFYLTVLEAVGGRADLEVLISLIGSLDEEKKTRWFLAVAQSSDVLSEETLFGIIKRLPQHFPWDFLAKHFREDTFRRCIQPELERFEKKSKDSRFILAKELAEVRAKISRLEADIVFLKNNRGLEDWSTLLEKTKNEAFAFKERLNFTAELAAPFPKELLPSPQYADINEVLQKPLSAQLWLSALESKVLSRLELLPSEVSAELSQESLQNILINELHLSAQDFFFLGTALSISYQELMRDRFGVVAAHLQDLGLSSRRDLEYHDILRGIGNQSAIREKIVEVCKRVEEEKNEEDSYQVLLDEFQFINADFEDLGRRLKVSSNSLKHTFIQATVEWFINRCLSTRKEMKAKGILARLDDGKKPDKEVVKQRIIKACEEFDQTDSYKILLDEFQFNNDDFEDLGARLKVSGESTIHATVERFHNRGLSTGKRLIDQGILTPLDYKVAQKLISQGTFTPFDNGKMLDKNTIKERMIKVCEEFDQASGPEQPDADLEPHIVEEPRREQEALPAWIAPARVRPIFARALQGLLIFVQVAEWPRSTAFGFLVGLALPERRFPFFEGRILSLMNMSDFYSSDPSHFSLDEGLLALSWNLYMCFHSVVSSVDYGALGGGVLAGVTHARMIRRIY